MLAGRLPSVPELLDSDGLPLRKPDGGIRSVAIGEAWLRLRALCACYKCEALGPSLASLQLGVGIPHGAEAVGHAVRTALSTHPDHLHMSLDCKNAFNSISRHAIFSAARVLVGLPTPPAMRRRFVSQKSVGRTMLTTTALATLFSPCPSKPLVVLAPAPCSFSLKPLMLPFGTPGTAAPSPLPTSITSSLPRPAGTPPACSPALPASILLARASAGSGVRSSPALMSPTDGGRRLLPGSLSRVLCPAFGTCIVADFPALC
jgi:hypothetical protein